MVELLVFLLAVLASETVWIDFDVEPNMLPAVRHSVPDRQSKLGILDHHDSFQ